MKVFIGIFIFILASAYLQVGADGEEVCAVHNCLKSEECETTSTLKCKDGLTCCSLVRSEYRNKCPHWGGHCTSSSCSPKLVISPEKAIDCKSSQVCCVLV